MTHRPYPSYKDSGIEWLGEVPEHWEVKRLRFVASPNPSKQEVAVHPRTLEVDFLPMDAVGEDGSLRLDATRAIADVETGYTYFAEGDVSFAKITPCFENGKGAVMKGLAHGFGFGTTELTVLRPDHGQILSKYLWYITASSIFRKNGEAWMYGAGGQKRVPDDFARNLALGFPPLPEQQAIAAFLDRETAKIDGLVAEQERLIELLTEKRQAVISHAVTRGLDPSVPLKVGVEWLGQVPEHWEVKRLRMVAEVQTGVAKGKDNEGRKTVEVPYLRVANVQDGYLDLTEIAMIEIAEDDLPRYLLRAGDVLMNEGGDFDKLGRGHIWRGEIDPCIHQNHVFAVRPRDVLPEWLNSFTGADFAQFFFKTRSKQSTNLASISSTNLMELPLLVPPLPEQQAIAAYLDEQTTGFDALMAEARRGIELLKERRTALISAAVTGKIDVREGT